MTSCFHIMRKIQVKAWSPQQQIIHHDSRCGIALLCTWGRSLLPPIALFVTEALILSNMMLDITFPGTDSRFTPLR